MLSILLIVAVLVGKFVVYGISNIKTTEFKPVVSIFLLDISATNRQLLPKQQQTVLRMAKKMDSEDQALIYVVTQDAFNIYNGKPNKIVAMRDAMQKRSTFDDKAYGTAYGLALKKAIGDALIFKEKGYRPAIVILGDLENEGAIEKQINWKLLPKNLESVKKYIPDLTLVFLYATPEKLDDVRQNLVSVVGEDHLIVAQEENVEQAVKEFSTAIGR